MGRNLNGISVRHLNLIKNKNLFILDIQKSIDIF